MNALRSASGFNNASGSNSASGFQPISVNVFEPYDSRQVEARVLEFWKANEIPKKLSLYRRGGKKFFLLDGPPYVNALPHVGHAKTTTYKDVWTRFAFMQGFDCVIQPGFDCHGLPVEVIVEKELGVKNKREIEERVGIKKFDEACLNKILNNERVWMKMYESLGAWRAFFEPYFTYKNYYIESAWWTLKRLHEKGFLTRGFKPIHWCPHCETALSGYEVSDSYKNVTDPSVFVKFPVFGKKNEFLLVWTTTPWTLAANVAIVVHPSEEYVLARVKASGETLVVAKKLVERVLREKAGVDFEVLKTFKGVELDGLRYEPVLNVPQQCELDENSKARRVYLSIPIFKSKKYKKHAMSEETGKSESKTGIGSRENKNSSRGLSVRNKGLSVRGKESSELDYVSEQDDRDNRELGSSRDGSSGEGSSGEEVFRGAVEEFEEFVTMEEGTGLVHCAPGHGQSDYFLGEHYGLPVVSPVDERGCFTEKAGSELAGMFVKDADKLIINKLSVEGKLFYSEKITHSYPLCWRCKSPLVFRLSEQWYLKIDSIKDKLLEANARIKWMPPSAREAEHNWLVDAVDWCVSKQRFWGIPMPIWVCEKCESITVVGSVAELREKAVEKVSDLKDLHRHSVDEIELKCGCGGRAKRVKDVFDVWFDSSIAPWASLKYPFENKEAFEELFPVHLIDESQDQIRGWFYYLLFSGMAVFGKPAFERCCLNGWVVDEKGEKMSKSLGNVVSAEEGIAALGADALRLYYCLDIAPWEVQKFSLRTAMEVKKMLNILWNSYAFYKTYAPKDFKPTAEFNFNELEDAWLLSRAASTVKKVTMHVNEFEFHQAGRALTDFIVEDLSRWYIKLVRDRMSPTTTDEKTRVAAANALHYAFKTTLKLLAPFAPFISEYLYADLKKNDLDERENESIHFTYWPQPAEGVIDEELEQRMLFAQKVTEAVNSMRREAQIKARWPVREVVITGDVNARIAVKQLNKILLQSCNSMEVRFSESTPTEPHYVAREISVLNAKASVFLNTQRDEVLMHRALFRELVRAIQAARKEKQFNVFDKISLAVWISDLHAREFFEENARKLALETNAESVFIARKESELKESGLRVFKGEIGETEGEVVLNFEDVMVKAKFYKIS